MSRIQAPRGVADTLPAESWKWQAVEKIARETAGLYHFEEIRTPIFEDTQLFHRGVGETTDVVAKETFTFNDRGGDSITLRPEGTAGVVRAVIEHNLAAQEGARLKVYYIGPNFRYERPQKGRLRQHHQFGVEAFGLAEPEQDVECILLQLDFYRRCGVKDLELQINSLGDKESKARYRDALVAFLTPQSQRLSDESRRRLSENPLRILDSKDPRDQEACKGTPPAAESLSEKSRGHFHRVRELLELSQVPYTVNQNLVRGFDYYTETLWEVTASGLGSQNAIGGGGRYDNLVENLGGRPTPGVGFGSGVERLLIALDAQNVTLPDPRHPLVWIAAQNSSAREVCWKLLTDLRAAGISADMDLADRSLKAQFKQADRQASKICLVLGDAEIANAQVAVKVLKTGEQTTVARAQLIDHLRTILQNPAVDIVTAITGASGAAYAQRFIQGLVAAGVNVHLVVSPLGRRLLHDELGMETIDLPTLAGSSTHSITLYNYNDVGSKLASGSFLHQGMVIVPCSSNTLGEIAAGLGDNLISRAAAVALKERRKLILVHREMPLSPIDVNNYQTLTQAGVILAPANPGFYLNPTSVSDLVDFVAGKLLDLLGIAHSMETRWNPRP